jgi:hypothetical protein
MIQIRFTSFEFNSETEQWIHVPIAELIADGQAVTISGPHADWISLDIAIIDPDTRERVTRGDDAERWARLLPFAYRNGDISVEVAEVATAEPAGASFHYYAEA